MKKTRVLSLICIAVFIIGLSVTVGCADDSPAYRTDATQVPAYYSVSMNESDSGSLNTSLTDVIEGLRQQVVDIYATASDGTYAGSGVIIASGDGYSWVITNHHVIEDCYAFYVDVLSIDKTTLKETVTTYEADLIGGNPRGDIAVLRIAKDGLPAVTWITDSDKVRVGTEVIAIGNPLGILGGTVTKGIVSATARGVNVSGIGVMTLMQTDAAINSGNSGGGLFSTDGLLVGIVNSGYTDYEGLNFAIPANDAKASARSLIETYSEGAGGNVVNYGYIENASDIGIEIGAWDTAIYSTSSTSSPRSLLAGVYSVKAGSDAAKANVTTGYAILSLTYGGQTYSYSGTDLAAFTSYFDEIDGILNNAIINTTVTLECSNVLSNKNYYYLGNTKVTYEITVTQYIYTPPTVA